MKITRAVLRITVSLLCAVLIFNGLPLHAAGPSEELRHEAFLRGGQAIANALTVNSEPPVVIARLMEEPRAAMPPAPAPAPRPQAVKKSGMSKLMWASLIGGFAVGGAVVYWVATGPGASIRNCSTCQK
jgi:hypothetical protein